MCLYVRYDQRYIFYVKVRMICLVYSLGGSIRGGRVGEVVVVLKEDEMKRRERTRVWVMSLEAHKG